MTTLNALPSDIFSRILEYNTHPDISNLSLGCKQNSADIKSIGELNQKKRIREKTNFLEALGLYVDKYNNDSKQYIFDIPKIKEYFKSSHLNDKSLVVNGTNEFMVDEKMITTTTKKSLYRKNIIKTVIEFIPECAYNCVERSDDRLKPNTEIYILKHANNTYYVLVNSDEGIKEMWSLEQLKGGSIVVIIGPLVTSISDYAFYNCKYLTTVIIGNSVTSIGRSAFYDCKSLKSIIIPDSVTSIGDFAFRDCKSLSSVIIGNSVTSIGEHAFSGCKSLTSVVIPDSVTSIGGCAFHNCKSLNSIFIPNSVTSIEYYAFGGCSSLTSVVIPNSVTSIEMNAFAGCKSLTSVIIPNSVTSIGDIAFYNCSGLTSIVIPNSVTSIGKYAFIKNTKLIRR